MYLKSFDKKECSGCTACIHACPKQCISMEQDNEGFYYPVVDNTKCIECGLCEKTCPIEHPKHKNSDSPTVYAAYVKEVAQRKKSTSGGIFYSIAKWTIDQGGIVYGAAFDSEFKLLHIGIDNMKDLEKLRGSKYLQSYLGNTYTEIKEHLKNGRWVYFTGCGCQVAGLYAFLRKEYETLITSDLVCHGVPSQLMFDWHLDYLHRKENAEITSYSFRKLDGWGGCETYEYVSQTKGKCKKENPSYMISPYLYSFMYAYNYRYSCYDCKFAQIPRVGDITLADFWGVRKYFPDLETQKGVSLILLNSIQGEKIWEKIKQNLIYRVSNLKDAAAENGNLIHQTKMPPIRQECYKMIKERGYEDVAKKEFRIKRYWLHALKYRIITSIFYNKIKNIFYRNV